MLSGKDSYTAPSRTTPSYGKLVIYNALETATSALGKTFTNYRIYFDMSHDLPSKYKLHQ